MNTTPSAHLNPDREDFQERHLGAAPDAMHKLLDYLGLDSLEALTQSAVPENIRLQQPLQLPAAVSEPQALKQLAAMAAANRVCRSHLGLGYYGTYTPTVIQRNVLENPAWYTAYTPYQPEISQGRLEGLLNFQQLITDLSGMELANASLLDEATAAAEAMTLCRRVSRRKTQVFGIAEDVFPQTRAVVISRAHYFGYEVKVASAETLAAMDCFGILLQYPAVNGEIRDLEPLIAQAHAQDTLVAVAADLLALVALRPPGEMGADVVLGSAQRFGVPMGYGGPHAAFFATRERFKRATPGRIIGVSVDSRGRTALRMAMQTREQHIRREKATSNICTAQALLANMAGFYAVYHGPRGLERIARRVARLTARLAAGLQASGRQLRHSSYFDTLLLEAPEDQQAIIDRALDAGINLRAVDADAIAISLDETTSDEDVDQLRTLILPSAQPSAGEPGVESGEPGREDGIPDHLRRTSPFLEHPVFNSHHSETAMLRYLKRLENRDFSLVHGMIPLGSCTMKLNASTQMIPLSWPGFAHMHPYAPADQARGYQRLVEQLEAWLVAITGYERISMQPNSGAQGEYAGLLAIRGYQQSIGQGHRRICLIPASAHGTNPASAVMAGLKVVVVGCDANGNVDVADLKTRIEEHRDELSCLMITYPSTHGVFEEAVREICERVHEAGGQVYTDGANMNALVGLARPGDFGSDVSHLNLHKTFAIPHGGGGPGMGPIGVKAHLAPFLPGHLHDLETAAVGPVAATPFGSASLLSISWAYCALLGAEGLKRATQVAILNANYLCERLAPHYPVLYRGRNDRVAHECILDLRPFKDSCGITEEDVAKRLMDYGFHAPTMSFPVPGTLMIEPTESESPEELDRFAKAMIAIREEIAAIEAGQMDADNNPLKNAPHTQADLCDDWSRPYSRRLAVFPASELEGAKFWPAVNRIDNVYGDRNLFCSCPPVDTY